MMDRRTFSKFALGTIAGSALPIALPAAAPVAVVPEVMALPATVTIMCPIHAFVLEQLKIRDMKIEDHESFATLSSEAKCLINEKQKSFTNSYCETTGYKLKYQRGFGMRTRDPQMEYIASTNMQIHDDMLNQISGYLDMCKMGFERGEI